MESELKLPRIVSDNDIFYLRLLFGVVDYTAPNSSIKVLYTSNGYNISIESSQENFRQDIINNLLGVHKLLGLKIKFSSSLAISKLIQYSVGNIN